MTNSADHRARARSANFLLRRPRLVVRSEARQAQTFLPKVCATELCARTPVNNSPEPIHSQQRAIFPEVGPPA
jgi:hypothetical protein